MERCDFSSVIRFISQYISETHTLNQSELIYKLFELFADENPDYEFDNGQICRWFKGAAAVSPKIVQFYQNPENAEQLAWGIEDQILPILYDAPMAAQALCDLVENDTSISEQKRSELTADYSCEDNAAIASFISVVLRFSMERRFIKRDSKLLTNFGTLSPIASDRIYDGTVPKPCKHFCGRDDELKVLHESLSKHGKVFVNGIPGIGKSEFVKAYAAAHKKDYTNILYFTYPGSLQEMIADMDFADDMPGDDDRTRFKKHNRFLRSLKEDTLLIIENFNTTASAELVLDVLMKYNCRIIFTTRSRFEIGLTYELHEISDLEALLNLSAKLFPATFDNREIVTQIIETVHRHTLAVELAARLLQSGMLEPDEVLQKLSECHINPDTADKIKITKDGINSKATYYTHIHTLFSLYLLNEDMQAVMRYMVFVPVGGIRGRMLARWAGLSSMDNINDLVELGFIQEGELDKILLHPLVQEIVVVDLKPSVTNCKIFLDNLHEICLRHGEDVPYYETLFRTIENVADLIKIDTPADFLLFVEDAFAYMEKYRFASGMAKMVDTMDSLAKTVGTENDCALLLNNQASIEGLIHGNYNKGISLLKQAIDICNVEENATLAANLHMNIGFLYQYSKQTALAKKHMEQGMILLQNSGVISNDMIIMARNYARLLAQTGEPRKAVTAMEKCAALVRSANTVMCTDYADMIMDIAVILLKIANIQIAEPYFAEAFRVYRAILPAPDLLEKAEIAARYFRGIGAEIPDYLAIEG